MREIVVKKFKQVFPPLTAVAVLVGWAGILLSPGDG